MQLRIPSFHAFRRSRWYKRLLWAGAAFLVYVLVGFFVLPPIIKSQLVKRLPPVTKRSAAVRQVKFNPLVLSLTIRGLSLTEPDGQVFASWEELYVNFQLSSLVRFAWTFAEVGLKQPYGYVGLSKEGRFNFANMIEETAPPPPKPEKPGAVPRVNVWHLHIDEGALELEDDTHRVPLRTEFKPINISLTNLTTRVGKDSVYSFRASSDSGRSFAWTGTLMVQPFQSRGHFELLGGQPPKWTPLLRDFLRAEIAEGRLNVRADYAVSAGTNGFDATVTNAAVELTELKIKDLNTDEIVTGLSSLSVQPLDFDLRRRNLHVGEVKIDGFTKTVRVEKDGRLNLELLLDLPAAAPPATNAPADTAGAAWTFTVDDVAINDAAVSFADLSRSNRFETTLKPIRIHVQHFTTRPDSDAAYDFGITTEAGEKIVGRGTFAIAPLRSDGEIKLAGFEVRKYAPYYRDNLRGEVLAGKADAGVNYHFAGSSNAPVVTVSNAGVALTGFELKAADTGEKVVGIHSFSVERTEASLAERRIQVGLVKSGGGSALVRRAKDGKINLLNLVNQPAPAPADASSPARASAPWTVLLEEITFNDYAIKLEDQKLAKPASLSLDQLGFNLKGLSSLSNAPITASLSARMNRAGTATVQGTAKIAPPMADCELAVSNLDLRPFQPYLNEHVRMAITSGRLSTHGRVRYSPPGSGAPVVKFAGELNLTNLATTDMVLFKEFVKWDDLRVSGIDFGLQPNQLQVEEVSWRGLDASIIIGPDQRLNLKSILPEKTTNALSVAASKPPGAGASRAKTADFPLQLNTLMLEDASFHFVDQSIEPRCGCDVQELSGTIKGLSSQEQSAATVDLNGKVDATSPFAIAGKVNPLAKDLQLGLTVSFTNTDLTAFSTYLEKYAGHPLNKGKLSMGLRYDINQKQLKAENKFLLDRFTLGPRNDNTNATSLPVKLAVALLKDRNGQINLDVPLSGRTDDPQFKIAPVIFKVVMNLIIKAATSPFSLLGALVGGGEELSFVEFEPGQANIPEAELQKLDKLVKALEERPALNLEITGSFDSEKDRLALARGKLERHLKVLRLKELADAGKAVSELEAVVLEEAQRERLLTQLMADLGTNQTLVLQAAAAALNTNAVALAEGATPAGQIAPSPAGTAAAEASRVRRPTYDSKGAQSLMPVAARKAPTGSKAPATPQLLSAPDGTPMTMEQVESRLVAAVPVSANEQRELIKQRAQAVQARILQTGKVAGERLFLVTPKTVPVPGKGEARANLSLD